MAEHRKPDPTEEYVRTALKDAAQAHRPNRDAMVDRVAVGRARSRAEAPRRPRPLFTMRPVGAAAAVVSVVIASMFAARFADGAEEREVAAVKPPPAVTAPATAHPTPTTPADPTDPQHTQDAPPATTPTTPADPQHTQAPPPPPTAPAGTPSPPPRNEPGWMESAGYLDPQSSDAWSQNNVRVSNTEPITSLEITIAVARTPKTAYAGRFTSAANDYFAMTVTPSDDKLTYTYVMRDGVTLKPGKYVFAAQYTHDSGHKAAIDSYSVVAETRTADAKASGTFSDKP